MVDYFLENGHPYLKKLKEYAASRGIALIPDPYGYSFVSPHGVQIVWFTRERPNELPDILVPIEVIAYIISRASGPEEIHAFLENQIVALGHELGHARRFMEEPGTQRVPCSALDSKTTRHHCWVEELWAYIFSKEIFKGIMPPDEYRKFCGLVEQDVAIYSEHEIFLPCKNAFLAGTCNMEEMARAKRLLFTE